MHTVRALTIQVLERSDLLAMAQSMAIDASAFPYPSIPLGVHADILTWLARGEEDTRVVGFLSGRARARFFYVHGLAVSEASRRQGIARALLRTCVAWAAGGGLAEVALHVGATNRPAMALYESEGFEAHALVRDFYRPGVYEARDAYRMVLHVRPSGPLPRA